MRAFVTGATGFLGSHLVDRLLEKKWELHLLVRKSSDLRWLLGKKVHYHYGDIVGETDGLRAGLKEADVCFHLAGVITARRPETYFEVNAQGTARLLETALKVNPKIKRVVITTSLAAHGPGRDDRPATEEDDCHPITDYGRSKRDAELIALRYRERLPITIIRPPAIYGPRDRQVFRYFWMARKGFLLLPGRGVRLLNIAYVQDVVTGLILAAEKAEAAGKTYFIGDKRNYDWEEVADLMGRAVHHKALKIHVPESLVRLVAWGYPTVRANLNNFLARNWSLDIGKARRELGYEPHTPLTRGVDETVAWYFENGWL